MYPIIEQRQLAAVPQKGFFSRGKRTREPRELPPPSANHRLVYLIAGDYEVDNFALPLDSDKVLSATHVSVVDVTDGAVSVVQLDIPTSDADNFILRVSFVCTVTDPVVVVRDGTDAAVKLDAYLRGHNRIFELGLQYRLAEINSFRVDMNAQVRAYATIKPPIFSGMTVAVTSVEVLTPDELKKFEESMRSADLGRRLEAERQQNRQFLDYDQATYLHAAEARTQRHTLGLEAEKQDHVRAQHVRTAELLRDDPTQILLASYQSGEISAREFADTMTRVEMERQDRKRADDLLWDERDREERRQLRELENRRRERKTEFARMKYGAEREDDRQAREMEHDKWMHLEQRKAEAAQLEREDKRVRLEAQLNMIKVVAERGHFDMVNLDLDKILEKALELEPPTAEGHGGEAPAALDAGLDPQPDGSTDTDLVREDDHDD